MTPLKNQKIYYAYIKILGTLLRHRAKKGIEVTERDWDNLLLLDACRYDIFKETNTIEGRLEKVRSKATETPQWLKRNFKGRNSDIVYIAGNPYIEKLSQQGYFNPEKQFHKVENLWDHGWDEELNTVPPDKITEALEKAREEYPEKRILAHYMQPHEPFIGEKSIETESDGWAGKIEKWYNPKVKEAYRENLKIVLESIEKLLPQLEGKTVITSDHGELIEPRYGMIRHPKDIFLPELYEVPWLQIE